MWSVFGKWWESKIDVFYNVVMFENEKFDNGSEVGVFFVIIYCS